MPPKKRPKDSTSTNSTKTPVVPQPVSSFTCPICCDIIIDNKDGAGDDSIYCEGLCDTWIHRRCAGLSTSAFKTINEDPDKANKPYKCPHCCLVSLSKEVVILSSTVHGLSQKIEFLQRSLSLDPMNNTDPPSSSPDSPSIPPSNPDTVQPSTRNSSPVIDSSQQLRKFNIVVSGIDESPAGTPRTARLSQNLQQVSTILSQLDTSLPDNSIRDCIRLGKFNPDKKRPVLVTLNRVCDVAAVLSNKHKLSTSNPGVNIRPDLSPNQRKVRSLLLKERFRLIQSGSATRSSVRMNQDSLFIDGNKYGSVSNGVFKRCQPHPPINQDEDELSQSDERLSTPFQPPVTSSQATHNDHSVESSSAPPS